MKKVIVTGGTGFLGKHLADSLIEKGYSVVSYDFRPPVEKQDGAEFILGDIRNYNSVAKAVEGCDVVFHLAAIPSIARAKYKAYYDINVLGTENVLRAAREFGATNFVHVSSSTVYGIPKKFPLTEDDTVENVGNYGRSKIDAENLCYRYASKELNISIIRPRVIMGAGRIGIFSILFDAIISNKPVFLIGKGNNIFQFTGIKDMVGAIVLASEHNKPGSFNIGSKDKTVVRDVMKGLIGYAGSSSKIIPIPAFIVRSALKVASYLRISPLINEQYMIADKDFMLDTSKAEKELGWIPIQTNLGCLVEAFDWYKENRRGIKRQFLNIFGVLGRFKHSQQGGFQDSDKGMPI